MIPKLSAHAFLILPFYLLSLIFALVYIPVKSIFYYYLFIDNVINHLLFIYPVLRPFKKKFFSSSTSDQILNNFLRQLCNI